MDEHLTEQLDKDFASLLQSKAFLSLSQPKEANALKELPTKGHSNSESKEKALTKVL